MNRLGWLVLGLVLGVVLAILYWAGWLFRGP